MKGFESIEIPEIKDDEEIKFGIINPKIESITNFSKEKKKLFLILRGKFWESLSKKCSEINKDNIELCSTLRILFKKYNSLILGILPEENKIRDDINKSFKNGIFTHLIDKIIKEYIKTNKITNIEIIDLSIFLKNNNHFISEIKTNITNMLGEGKKNNYNIMIVF